MQSEVLKKRGTIAVFDDDKDQLEIFQFILEGEGYSVVCFDDVTNFTQRVRAVRPILLLMDNWMPILIGEDAICMLRSQVDLKHIPVILISASSDIKDAAVRAGADGYIAKPFEFEQVIEMVDRLTSLPSSNC